MILVTFLDVFLGVLQNPTASQSTRFFSPSSSRLKPSSLLRRDLHRRDSNFVAEVPLRFTKPFRILGLFTFIVAAAANSQPQSFSTVSAFNFFNGDGPYRAPLLHGQDGNLYGTANSGGTDDWGTVFKITATGELSTLYSFKGYNEASYPIGKLLQNANGDLYGAAYSNGPQGGGAIYKLNRAGHLAIVHKFCSQDGCLDGYNPQAGVIEASDGNLYGTTEFGGAFGGGVVYRITGRGEFTVIHNFCAEDNCADGKNPVAELLQGRDGNLYGTTFYGGNGGGVVFRIGRSGAFSVMHAFSTEEGSGPSTGLVQASDGNFYGTTQSDGVSGFGTIFRMTTKGVLTTLYNFNLQSSGYAPLGTLLQATDSHLYGTTSNGSSGLYGAVFRMTLDGSFEVLHQFEVFNSSSWIQGGYPDSGLVQAADGKLYGTTYIGGIYSGWCWIGCGTVYNLDIEANSRP